MSGNDTRSVHLCFWLDFVVLLWGKFLLLRTNCYLSYSDFDLWENNRYKLKMYVNITLEYNILDSVE